MSSMPASPSIEIWAWRHPRAIGAAGRCIGRTDIAVDPRKARRLAHRIRAAARRHGLPRVVTVSPLARARAVGRVLAGWGWRVQVDARLQELDFGAWDGRRWDDIAWAEVQAWQDDLLHHAPGGGESLAGLVARVQSWCAGQVGGPQLVVSHGGWLNGLALWRSRSPIDSQDRSMPSHLAAADWPAPPRHGQLVRAQVQPVATG